ncbi:MAG: thioredoxin domain-containing protein [Candidatus Acidiferrum sp.]
MKRYLPFVIIAAVALLTVGAGAMLYRAKRHPPPDASATPKSVNKIDEKKAHVRGGADAPVTLEEFGDFQCPSCSLVSELIHQLEQDYRPRLRVVFRQFPLKMHSHALEAALAAEAAGSQGRFWEMHDYLYKYQTAWSKVANVQPLFESYASNVGLDVERFKKDLQTTEVNLRVASDGELGLSRGVKNTPTIFINGGEVPAPFTRDSLHEAIETALTAKKGP